MNEFARQGAILREIRFFGAHRIQNADGGRPAVYRVSAVRAGFVHLQSQTLNLTARNEAELKVGDVVLAELTRLKGDVVLKILRRNGLPRGEYATAGGNDSAVQKVIHIFGLSDTRETAFIIHAILSSGKKITHDLIQRAVRVLRKSGRFDRTAARWAVEAADRELGPADANEDMVREMIGWFDGGDQRRSRDPSRQQESEKGSSHLIDTQRLRRYCTRRSSRPVHPLQLFNVLRPATGDYHWIVIPIRGTAGKRDGTSLDAVLKIALEPATMKPRRALLSVDRDGGRWWFSWTVPAGGGTPVLDGAGTEGSTGDPPVDLLATLGFTGHTVKVENEGGFPFHGEAGALRGIDHYG